MVGWAELDYNVLQLCYAQHLTYSYQSLQPEEAWPAARQRSAARHREARCRWTSSKRSDDARNYTIWRRSIQFLRWVRSSVHDRVLALLEFILKAL
mmetsp:Transcript_11396/g.31553  ORF Transcript_11396/g.31553 Transcript_11396/m.31553 type:complete len:96 (+) Transcript_11396:587-874(+)